LNSILQEETQFIGEEGSSISFKNMNIKLNDVQYIKQDNYYKQQANFWITFDKGKQVKLSPENRLYKIENTMLPEVAIKNFWFYDLYSILNFSSDGLINATFYYKPFMSFIWFSLIIIILGILI
jgi:cytochrome c biogenesis factor